MAATSSSFGAHVRSTSWPEDVHPLTRSIENHLLILKKSPESARRKLGVLKNMYEVVEVFLRFQSSKTQKAFLEDVSDGFLEVLDICYTLRDVLMEIKEQVRELESSLRRRVIIRSRSGGDQEAFLTREIDAYVFKRRVLSRKIGKQLKMKNKKKKDCVGAINVMKKVKETSFDVLVSLLMEVVTMNHSHHKKLSRSGSRGIISRMFNKKNQEVEGDELKKLRETEQMIEATEGELECVYKKLLKTRVSLLNMLTL
ncbi:T235 protein [Hirschfeldia incana]|nr:T235 protein [Hirschfeldia incana]